MRSAYEARLLHMGRPVVFEQNGARAEGIVRGVAGDGALRVECGDGEEALLYSETIEAIL